MKVKIKLVFAGMCILALNFFANAQNSVSIRQKIHQQFAPLKTSTRLNTGYLYDKANASTNVYNFGGDSNADTACSSILRQLVWQQENAYLLNDKDASLEVNKMDSIANYYIVNNYHPLAIILGKYNEFVPQAIDSGWIGFNNDSQLVETNQNSPNPYREFNLYAAGALVESTTAENISFIINQNLIYNNTGLEISKIEINLGNGYVQMYLNQPYQYEIKEATTINGNIKISFSNNSFVLAKFSLNKKAKTLITEADYVSETPITSSIGFDKPSCATINTGRFAKARYYVKYSYTRADNKIRKPIIFVEGFDPLILDDLPFKRYGEFGWDVFSSGGINGRTGKNDYPSLTYMPTLITTLLSAPYGYDVILVDFENGGDYVQKNAYALIKILEEIKQKKVGNEEMVVVGTSMGGLISRYALTYMEQNNMPHCVRLWTSFDAPHNGANIPIGLQAGIGFFANFKVEAEEALNFINSPAAMQMLLRHRGITKNGNWLNPDCYRNNLVSSLNQFGFPEKPRKIAMLNGSITTNGQGFGHATTICDVRYNAAGKIRAQFNVKSQSVGNGNVFNGAFTKTEWFPNWFTIYNINTWPYTESYSCPGGNCANLDGAPGGTHKGVGDFFDKVDKAIRDDGHSPDVSTKTNDGRTCFIPTISSLAIYPSVTTDYFYDVKNNISQDYTGQIQTPFEAYNAKLNTSGIGINEPHVYPDNDNTSWMLDQLTQNEYKLASTLPNSNGNRFNMATFYQRKLNSLNVNNNGVFHVNGNYKNFYSTATDLMPIPNKTISLYTGDCNNANIRIHSGGKFIIGDNNNIPYNNKALVYITAGSSLTIRNGGELKIHANSKLIIQKGAQLIIENGAIVNLIDANGALIIEGELKMEQNATFATNGNGYVHFKKTTNSSPVITSVGNNTIHIKGNGSSASIASDPINLLIEGGVLSIPVTLNLFKIENSKCEFVNQSGLSIFAQGVEIINSNFNKTSTSTQKHKGIQVNGNPLGQNFNYVRIDHAETAISGHMEISVSSELNLNNVRFYDCGLALETVGGSFNWSNGGAERCSTLVVAQASDGFNYIDNITANRGTINAFGTGINFTGGTNTYLQIQKSTITGYDYNLRAYNVWLDLKCNTFLNSIIDEVYIENALLSSSVPMGTGYNIFKGQNWSLFTDNATVYLNEGYSSYNSNVLSIPRYGISKLSCAQPLSGNDVLANYNEWKLSPNYYGFELTCNSNYSGIFDNNIINTAHQSYINMRNAYCGFNTVGGGGLGKTNSNSGNVVGEYLTSNTDTSIILNTTKFINKTFAEAFQLTVNKFNSKDSLKNYFDIINEFKDIVTSNNQNLSRNERIVKRNSYIKILHCLAFMVTKKKIAVAANIAINSTISDILNLQNGLLSRIEIDSTWMNWKFRINFDKALIYKMAEKNDIALQKLDSILLWNLDTNYTKLVNEWKCYINGETALANKTVTTDSLKYFYPCYIHKPKPNLYLALQKSNLTSLALEQYIDKKSLIKLFPNPTKEFIILETIDKTQKPNNIQIYDLLGKLLLDKMNTQMEGLNYKINVSNLPNGLYFMKVTFENDEFISKFFKE